MNIESLQVVINEEKYINLPIALNSFGIGYIQENIIRMHGIPIYQWIQCISGRGELVIGEQRFIINEGSGMFILPNIPHSYKSLSEEWKVNYITFNGKCCNEILHNIQLTETGVFKVADYKLIENQMYKFYEIYNSDSKIKHKDYSVALYEILLSLSMNISRIFSAEIISENLYVEAIVRYLENNYMKPISLDDIAYEVNVTKEYLCSLFKKHMKQTIISYLQIIRIANARNLLSKRPSETVKQIGKLCGFDNTSYFCRVFKKIQGITPQSYREKN